MHNPCYQKHHLLLHSPTAGRATLHAAEEWVCRTPRRELQPSARSVADPLTAALVTLWKHTALWSLTAVKATATTPPACKTNFLSQTAAQTLQKLAQPTTRKRNQQVGLLLSNVFIIFLLLFFILFCFCFNLCHSEPVESITNYHLPRLAALYNLLDLPIHNFPAGEEVHKAVVEVIMRGILKGDGPLADVARFAVTDSSDDGAVRLQLSAQGDAVVPSCWIVVTVVLRTGVNNSACCRLGDWVLNGVLSHSHVYTVVLVQQFRAGDVLGERHTPGRTRTNLPTIKNKMKLPFSWIPSRSATWVMLLNGTNVLGSVHSPSHSNAPTGNPRALTALFLAHFSSNSSSLRAVSQNKLHAPKFTSWTAMGHFPRSICTI